MQGNQVKRFVTRLKPVADFLEAQTGIKPHITLTQAAHESRYGESGLTVEGNNLFGMMASEAWIADHKSTIEMLTVEYSDLPPEKIRYWARANDVIEKTVQPDGRTKLIVKGLFRKYASWSDSVADWAVKITSESKYSKAADAARAGNLLAFAEEMERIGYATDKNYAAKIATMGGAILEALA